MIKHTHFIGIGGIGMSCIAQLLLRRGEQVSGSDLKEGGIIRQLKQLGATVYLGHDPAHIQGAELVVYSSAIKEDNPEIRQARAQGIPVIKRAQALAQLMEDKLVVTVTGSHGKTTTTSLASCLLMEAGLMPTVAIGGILRNIDTNAYFGDGNFFVAEADESDGSFLYYHPRYSIITNVDFEHLDYYKSFDNLLKSVRDFLANTQQGGCVFCCGDDENLRKLMLEYGGNHILFGLNENSHIYPCVIHLKGLASEFDCVYKGQPVGKFYLPLGGRHNISNALAVIALGLELGIGTDIIKKALANYKGAGRRIEIKYSDSRYTIIDDYAHHPTEIRATLAAVRNIAGVKRLIAVFQPHRFTRTKLLMDEFTKSFDAVDCLILTDIYPASEPPIEGISGRTLYEKIKERFPAKEIVFLPKEEITGYLLKVLAPGDVVITLGAGDIVKSAEELVEGLTRKQ